MVIDGNNEIIIGHGRVEAAKHLGLQTIPCVIADDLTDAQIKALRIADNKLSEKGIWDNDALKEELASISDDLDMTEFGFGDFELTILAGDFEPEPYDEDEIKEYEAHGDEVLKNGRVIITFNENNKAEIAKMLGLETIDKVVYSAAELLKK